MSRILKQLSFFVTILALVATVGMDASAGKKDKKKKKKENTSGTVDFILEHDDELKITPEQTKKLELLDDIEERVMADPAIKAIVEKIREVKHGGNEREFDAQKERLAEKIREKTNGQFTSFKTALGLILSPEQLKAFHELKKPGSTTAPKDGKDPKEDPAMPGKSLNPFEL